MKATLTLAAALIFGTTSLARAQGSDPPGVNPAHYQCYKVSEAVPFKPVAVTLKDQFGNSKATVVNPVMICAPTSKNGAVVKDQKTHLVCYQDEGPKAPEKRVRVQNQFGQDVLTVGGAAMLCVPSLKTVLK